MATAELPDVKVRAHVRPVISPPIETPRSTPPRQELTVVEEATAVPGETPTLWRFLWPMIRPYRWLVLGALVMNAMHGIAITFQTLMPKYLIDDVLLATNLTTAQRTHRLIWIVTAYLFASIVARMLVWHLGYRMFTYVREKVMFSMRANFFRHVNHLCLRFHIKNHSGELFSYLFGTPPGQVPAYFQQFTFGAPGALFILLSTMIWLGAWDWMMSGVLFLTVLATVILMQRTRTKVQRLFTDYQKVETTVSGYVADLLRGSVAVHVRSVAQTRGTSTHHRADPGISHCILVTSGGEIVQDGTYDKLLKQPGLFRDLVQGQVLRNRTSRCEI